LEIVDGGLDLDDEVIVGQVGETAGQVRHGLPFREQWVKTRYQRGNG
jgi:hypothetical protein